MSQSTPIMKQARRLPLLALDLVLLFALFGCASPAPVAAAPRHGTPVYVARPEFAGLVPLTRRARRIAVARPEFRGLVPLTPPEEPVRAPAADPLDWAPAIPALAKSSPAGWAPRVPAAVPSPAPAFGLAGGGAADAYFAGLLVPRLPAQRASLLASANLAFADPRRSPDAVAEAFDLALAQESAALARLQPAPRATLNAEAAEVDTHAESAEVAEVDTHAENAEAESRAESAEVAEVDTHAENAENAEAESRAESAEVAEVDTRAETAEETGEGSGEAEPSPSLAAGPAQAPPVRAAAPAIPWKTETYSLVARSMDLRLVLETFGVAQGISTILSPNVGGAISGEFLDVPCADFLDRLASLHNLVWYWDGATLWIYASGEMQTILLDLRYMKAGEVRAMLAELGVEDPRFPLKTASRDELIMVSGPPRYVGLVAEMIQKADVLRERRTFTEIETRIFPLQNTWADDVSFTAGSPETSGSIKGVASMLREIVGKLAAPGSRESGTTNAPTSFQALITAENRLNAVIVTDVSPRMPLYERLIKELDVPQKLVEIEVTVVELSRKDALDWQLSIAGTANAVHDRIEAGAGMNAGNLFDAANVAGRGLAGALTYLGSKSTVSASLTALRDKGKARNISRTTLLTVNNLAAELSDQQSYHARVVGTEVAELAEVSAGTSLQIKPRIMRPATDEAPGRIWLTLSLRDGGFESVSVDSMPMTRSSSLDTQTSVYEDDTIVLAGYLRDIEESAGWGIPFLRDLPLIGWLFGGHSSKTETVQRLFLISPRVVDADAEDLARIQAMRLRDIEEAEALQDDANDMDEVRELRELDRQERRERRQDALDERLKERRRELERAREERARLRKEREAELRKTEGRGGCLPW